jgi:hypothetical protein
MARTTNYVVTYAARAICLALVRTKCLFHITAFTLVLENLRYIKQKACSPMLVTRTTRELLSMVTMEREWLLVRVAPWQQQSLRLELVKREFRNRTGYK